MGTLEDALKQFMASNPDLPEGVEEDSAHQAVTTPKRQHLQVVMERKGRAGKTATIVTGFTLDDSEIAKIAAQLKSRLGTGGSSRGGEILIQGDRREDVKRLLSEMGHKVGN